MRSAKNSLNDHSLTDYNYARTTGDVATYINKERKSDIKSVLNNFPEKIQVDVVNTISNVIYQRLAFIKSLIETTSQHSFEIKKNIINQMLMEELHDYTRELKQDHIQKNLRIAVNDAKSRVKTEPILISIYNDGEKLNNTYETNNQIQQRLELAQKNIEEWSKKITHQNNDGAKTIIEIYAKDLDESIKSSLKNYVEMLDTITKEQEGYEGLLRDEKYYKDLLKIAKDLELSRYGKYNKLEHDLAGARIQLENQLPADNENFKFIYRTICKYIEEFKGKVIPNNDLILSLDEVDTYKHKYNIECFGNLVKGTLDKIEITYIKVDDQIISPKKSTNNGEREWFKLIVIRKMILGKKYKVTDERVKLASTMLNNPVIQKLKNLSL